MVNKKLYISADIEGIAGIAHWDEAIKNTEDYNEFRVLMTNEVIAACETAYESGFNDIVVKDAHGSGRNILIAELPEYVSIIRGWSGDPKLMVQGIDSSYSAAMFIGYHSKAGYDTNPLAHTISRSIDLITINDRPISELYLYSAYAGLEGVPVVFLSGDQSICDDARDLIEGIETFTTLKGEGASTISVSPKRSISGIKLGVKTALQNANNILPFQPEGPFTLQIKYNDHFKAVKSSYYPGARKVGYNQIEYHSTSIKDVIDSMLFLAIIDR